MAHKSLPLVEPSRTATPWLPRVLKGFAGWDPAMGGLRHVVPRGQGTRSRPGNPSKEKRPDSPAGPLL